MKTRWLLMTVSVFLLAGVAPSQERKLPSGEKEPFLRIETGGHMAYITAVAFGPDGKTLYSAGHDKVVRVWALDARGEFKLMPQAFRMPIGPGPEGIINSLAVSPDGEWLAAGGEGAARDIAGFRTSGIVLPVSGAMSKTMWQDRGQIYLFNTRTGQVRLVRGNEGSVLTLAFAPAYRGKHPVLASAALERDAENHKYVGVIRLWDVETGKAVDNMVLDRPLMRPGLAVRHTGPGLRQLRVAIAWGERRESKLRVWQLKNEGDLLYDTSAELPFNTAIAYLPGQRPGEARILSGGLNSRAGQLRWWVDPDDGAPRIEERAPYDFPTPNPDEYLIPQQLAFIPRKGADTPRQAAVVVARAELDGEKHLGIKRFNLYAVDLERPGAMVGTDLWKGSDMPTLAAAPGGGYLAVGGDTRTHNIHLLRLPLAAGAEAVTLHGVGTTFRHVAFGTNGKKELGLILGIDSKEGPGEPARAMTDTDFAFHIGQRKLTADPRKDWKVVSPDLDGWTVRFTPRDEKVEGTKRVAVPATFVVEHGAERKRITLPAAETVDDYTLLPPMNGIKTAILAVASWDLAAMEPLLYLYRVDTGEPVRQLKGHVEHIRSLAFARDGRLLASAAEDQTVAVWTLTNLDRVLDRRGLIPGLGVRHRREEKTVYVAQVKDDSPAKGKVQLNDVIEALVLPSEKEVAVKTAMEFYLAIFQLKPGDTVGLRLKGQGVVNVPVRQGIDERKPLFSLFVTDGEDRRAREWIGWSPVGPYDASGARAEDYLGWHFNTGDETKPTTFAPAGQYRKEYYREGILKYLVARGNPAEAVKDWENDRPPPARPVMTPTIDESGPLPKKDAQGRVLVQGLPATLRVGIDNIELDDIASVQWRFDGGQAQDFTGHERGEWSVDLSKQAWRRGTHDVEVVLRLKRDSIKEHTTAVPLRYLPPPPVVRLDPALAARVQPGDGQVLRLPAQESAKFRLKAAVVPAEGQDVKVTLVQAGKEVAIGRVIDEERELQPGENWFELRAQNANAPAEYKDYETSVWRIAVTHQPPRMVVPPEIVLNEVRFGDADNEMVKVVPTEPVIVSRRVVNLVGRITAKEALTDVKRDGQAIAGFQGKNELALNERLLLKVGTNKVELFANTKNSTKPAQTTLTIEYRPELPRLIVKKAGPQEIIKDAPRPKVEIEAELVLAANVPPDTPYTATLLFNGKEVAVPIKDRKLTATLDLAGVELKPGENVVQLRLSDPWKTSATEDVLRVLYRRPPRIVAIDKPAGADKGIQVDKQVIDRVVARVESAPDVDLTRGEVNGRPAEVRRVDKQRGIWEVEARNVPLPREGDNDVNIQVWNEDGAALKPRTFTARVALPRQVAPPVVRFTSPLGTSAVVPVPSYEARFTVKSDSPLRSIELHRGDEVVRFDPAKLQKNGMGDYEISVPVQLKAGPNPLEAVAVNEGGEGKAVPVTISYTPQPVHFEFDQVVLADQPNQELARAEKDKRITFGQAAGERILVRGSVVWPDEADPRLDQLTEVRVWVNGFQQVPVRLKPRANKETRKREFEAEVGLNQPKGNRVEFELPGLAQEAGVRRDFLVDCTRPEPTKTWHILVVGVGDKDEEQLRKRVVKAVRSQPGGVGGAFQVRLYGPLTDDVSPEKVYAQLRRIKKEIDTRAAKGSANDVLMVYYIGEESVKTEGHFFTTDVSQNDPDLKRSGLSVERLRDSFLADTLGARVVLLDVAREKTPQDAVAAVDRVAQWTDKGRVGILRYSWQGGETIPTEARLLTAWNRFLDSNRESDKSIVLDDVSRAVSAGFKRSPGESSPRSTEYKGLMTLSENVPDGLRTLPVEQTESGRTKP